MLVINNKQIKVFDVVFYEKFYKKNTAVIKKCFSDKVKMMSEHDLLAKMRAIHQIASKYDIKTERGIVRFICLSFMLDQDFYNRPEFSQLFKYNDIDKDECMDLIFEDAKRIYEHEKPISSSLPPSNKNYEVVTLIQNIAYSLQ